MRSLLEILASTITALRETPPPGEARCKHAEQTVAAGGGKEKRKNKALEKNIFVFCQKTLSMFRSYHFSHRFRSLHKEMDCTDPGHSQCRDHPRIQGDRSTLLCCQWIYSLLRLHRVREHRGQWGWVVSPLV